MSISTDSMRLDYPGDGTDSSFSYTYEIQLAADIKVIVVEDATGDETTLTLTTHYTLTGVGNPAGGNVVLVNGAFDWIDGSGDLDTGWTIVLLRKPAFTQPTSISDQSAYYASIHEEALDRSAMRDQYLKDFSLRSIHIPEGEDPATYSMELPNVESRKGGALGFDSTTGQLAVSDGFSGSLTPTVTGVTVTGLTASQLVMTDASKALASVANGTAIAQTITWSGVQTLSAVSQHTAGIDITSAATQGLEVYNTADQATNYERMFLRFTGNVGYVGFEVGGSGTERVLAFTHAGFVGMSIQGGYVGLATTASGATVEATGKVAISSSTSLTATSGTHKTVVIGENFVPSASATTAITSLEISPTVNFASGGAGRVVALAIETVATALGTGRNAAIALNSGSCSLGGIQLYGVGGHTETNYERGTINFTGNAFVLSTSNGGSGTARSIVMSSAADTYDWRRDTMSIGTYNIYGEYTNSTNYSRLQIVADASAVTIYTGQAGTGGTQELNIGTGTGVSEAVNIFIAGSNRWRFTTTGTFIPVGSNYDIGSAAAQAGSIFGVTLGASGTPFTTAYIATLNRTSGTLTISTTTSGDIALNPAGDIAITDAKNITIGTGTGTKFGTSTSSKIGFYNKAPVAQQTGVAVDAAGIHAALVNLGLITA